MAFGEIVWLRASQESRLLTRILFGDGNLNFGICIGLECFKVAHAKLKMSYVMEGIMGRRVLREDRWFNV